MKSTKYTDSDKYRYSGYGIGFNARSQFSWSDGTWDKNIFGADMSLSVHDDNKNEDIFVFGEGLTQELGSNNFLFVNAVKMYQFKGTNSE